MFRDLMAMASTRSGRMAAMLVVATVVLILWRRDGQNRQAE